MEEDDFVRHGGNWFPMKKVLVMEDGMDMTKSVEWSGYDKTLASL